MSPRIFFSVGEPSGDQHAARLITEIQRLNPSISCTGFGGPAMQDAGCELELDLTQHAVFGLLEVLPKLREFFRFADQAEETLKSGQIDAVVLVDFPGFNWHIAKRAKRLGIPVFYYCPPQLWAWGGWRVRKMRRSVDHVLAVLPIEEQYFSSRGIPTTYVGHPFFDAVRSAKLDDHTLSRLNGQAEAGRALVAVLPGSRAHEVNRNWPLMLESIRRLHQRHPDVKFLVAAYRDSQCLWCRDQLSEADSNLPIEFFVGRTSEVIEVAACAMMVSGSVSLELMARRTPAVVIYRIGRFLHAFTKLAVRLDSMTLPNLMSGEKVFPEMVSSGDAEPGIAFLTESLSRMLADPQSFAATLAQIDRLRQEHARGGAASRAAEVLCDRLFGDQVHSLGRAA